MQFVLDNSVTMRWLFGDGSAADQTYARNVLAAVAGGVIWVPGIWCLEVANVIARAERKHGLEEARSAGFLHILEQMPIQIVPTTGIQSMNTILQLARRHRLSAYDAAYLSLCLQTGLPLATLDEDLLDAADRAGVAHFTG